MYHLLTILFYHVSFPFVLAIDLYFLIHAVITKLFNPTEELVPIGIPTNEVKVEIKTQSMTIETNISKYSI